MDQSLKDDKRANAGIRNIREPPLYDFHDWQSFKNDTLRYHSIRFPERTQIIDRVATFRSFMSVRVVQYLKSEHPEVFEDGEIDSWNQWLVTVTELLRARDTTIPRLVENPFDDPAESWKTRYEDGTIGEKQFWIELNELVAKEVISTDRQIRLFWESHSWEKQRRLVDLCPYFDPRDPVWDEDVSYADRMIAQRLLNDVMQSNIENEVRAYRKVVLVSGVLLCIAVVLAIIMFSLLALPSVSRYHNRGTFLAFVCIGVVAAALGTGCLNVVLVLGPVWRRKRRLQRSYHLGILPTA